MVGYGDGLTEAWLFLMVVFSVGIGLPAGHIEKAVGELHIISMLLLRKNLKPGNKSVQAYALDSHNTYNMITFFQQDFRGEGLHFKPATLENGNAVINIVNVGALREVIGNGNHLDGVYRAVPCNAKPRFSVTSMAEILPRSILPGTLSSAPQLLNERNGCLYKTTHYGERLQLHGYTEGPPVTKTAHTQGAIVLDMTDMTRNPEWSLLRYGR